MSWAWTSTPAQVGMNTWTSIASDSTGSKLCAGTSEGDIYISTDGGTTWTPTGNPNVFGLICTSIASDASGINLIAGSLRNAIFVSKDGGLTWTESYTSLVEDANGVNLSVASDASGVNLYVSSDGHGILISKDGGVSWTQSFPGGIQNWNHIACSSDGTRIFATCPGSVLGPGWYSINGGSTWNQMWSGHGDATFYSIACDSTGTKLITFGNLAGAEYNVWLSTDGGATWAPTGNPELSTIYFSSVTSDSTGTTLVACGTGAMWISKDSGATWTQKFTNDTGMNWNGVATDLSGINIVAFAVWGEIWRSTDGGDTWTAMNGTQIQNYVTNSYSIASDSTCSKLVLSGMGVYTSSDRGVLWSKRLGDGEKWLSVASDTTGLNLVTGVYRSPVVGAIGGDIWRSTDGGANWTPTGNPNMNQNWLAFASDATGSNLAAVVEKGDIWRSTDGGANWTPAGIPILNMPSWTSITSDVTGSNLAACGESFQMLSVDGSLTEYIGNSYVGDIWRSTDGGATWTPTGFVREWRRITSDSTGSKLVAFDSSGDIWRSTDGGATWTHLAEISGLFLSSISSDASGRRLLASTAGQGIWGSFDGGSTWSHLDGTDNVAFESIILNADGTLGLALGQTYDGTGTLPYNIYRLVFTPPSQILPPQIDSQVKGDIRPEVFETSIKYSWRPPASGLPDYYTLVVSPNPGGSPYTISTFESSYTVTGLTTGQSYEAYITGTSYGVTSDPILFRTIIPGNLASVPQDISANFLSATSAIVNWTPSVSNGGSPVQWYVVVANPNWLQDPGHTSPVTYTSADGSDTSCIVDGLNRIKYSFSVIAVNDPGYSQYLTTPLITNPEDVGIIEDPGNGGGEGGEGGGEGGGPGQAIG